MRRFPSLFLMIACAVVSTSVLTYRAVKPPEVITPFARIRAKYLSRPPGVLQQERLRRLRTDDFATLIAEKASNGTWSIQPDGSTMVWPDVREPLSTLWSGKSVANLTWQYSLHSLYILHDLVLAHQATGDPRHLETGRRVIQSWIRHNPPHDPPNRYSWGDHSTANRALTVCAFLDYCDARGLLDPGFKSMVAASLYQHAEFLAHPSNYTFPHNHGIFQDYALEVVATHLSGTRAAARWLRTVERRLRHQISRTFSGAGAHLENSPGYHVVTTALLKRIVDYMEATGDRPPRALQEVVRKASAASPYFIMPDGCVVPVGDTARGWRPMPMPGGKLDTFKVFPEAGYVVVREKPYVFFTASNNSFSHKHCDDLSVVVADSSGPILDDAGFLNYEWPDAQRAYTLAWAAHSTVTTAAEAHDPKARSLRSGIEVYGEAKRLYFARGRSIRRNDVEHVRSLLIDGAAGSILFVDDCSAPRVLEWQRRFLLAPGIEVSRGTGKGQFLLKRGDGTTYVLALWPADISPRAITGRKNPFEGWVAERFRKLVPTSVVLETQKSRRARFVAALSSGIDPIRIHVDGRGVISIQKGKTTTSVAARDGRVFVERKTRGPSAAAGSPRRINILLKPVEMRLPFKRGKPPRALGPRGRAKAILLNTGAWGLAILLAVGIRRRPMWIGFPIVVICAGLNILALAAIWPHLYVPL